MGWKGLVLEWITNKPATGTEIPKVGNGTRMLRLFKLYYL